MEIKTFFAQDRAGNLSPSSQCTIYLSGTNTIASIFDENGNVKTNPFLSDGNGKIVFSAADGIYDVAMQSMGIGGPRIKMQLSDLAAIIATITAAAASTSSDSATATAAKNTAVAAASTSTVNANQTTSDALAVAANKVTVVSDTAQVVSLANTVTIAAAALKIFPITTGDPDGTIAGLAATTNGQSFYVAQGTAALIALKLYINTSGAAVAQSFIAGQAAIDLLNAQVPLKLDSVTFNNVIQKIDESAGLNDVIYAVRDSQGYQTWLGVRRLDGGPSAQAERLIRDRIGVHVANNVMANGEELSFWMADKNNQLTDLAIRAQDGQLANFAVSRIGARILASVGIDFNTYIAAMQVSRDGPGFQTIASASRWALQRSRGESVASPMSFTTTTNSQASQLTFQTPYSGDGPMLLVIYFGGVGSYTTLTPPTEYAAALPDGIVWARCGFSGDNYGSPSAMVDVQEVYAQACRLAPIGGVVLLGNSAGGMPALNALTTHAVPGVLGLYMTDPVCNLFDRYNSERQGLIQTAYGISADGSNYDVKTAGYDPMLRDWSCFRGVPIYCIGSSNDTLVPYSTNSLALYNRLKSHYDFTLVDKGSTGHNLPDRFDVVALRAFIKKAASGTILK